MSKSSFMENDIEAQAIADAVQKRTEQLKTQEANQQNSPKVFSKLQTAGAKILEQVESELSKSNNGAFPSIIDIMEENRKKTEEFSTWKPKTPQQDEEIVVPYAPGKAPQKTEEKPAETKSQPEQTASASTNNAQNTKTGQHERMVKMIEYMNKINGANKSIDAEANAQMIEQKFGDKAYDVLYKAIMEPTNYQTALDAKNNEGKAIRLSREAVTHLANIDPSQVNDVTQKLLGTNSAENTPTKTVSAQTKAENVVKTEEKPAETKSADDKRKEDTKAMTDLANTNPEQYNNLKSLYQSIVEGNLPGVENAKYFLEIIKEVDAILQQILNAKDKTLETSSKEAATTGLTTQTAEKTAEEKKRQEDKTQCQKLFKEDPEKYAKAKNAYTTASKSDNDGVKKDALYFLGIMDEVEKEDKLKKTMQKDTENATQKADKDISKIEGKNEKPTNMVLNTNESLKTPPLQNTPEQKPNIFTLFVHKDRQK